MKQGYTIVVLIKGQFQCQHSSECQESLVSLSNWSLLSRLHLLWFGRPAC